MRVPQAIFRNSTQKLVSSRLIGSSSPSARPKDSPPQEVWDAYHKIMAGRQPVKDDGPVANLVRKFLLWVETERPKCEKWYRQFLESFLAHIGDKLALADLQTHHIDDWVSKSYKGKSSSCRAGAVRAVSRVFNWADKKGHYKGPNPAKNAERPAVKPRGNEAYLSPAQIDKILSVIDETDPFKQLVYALALYGGHDLRRGPSRQAPPCPSRFVGFPGR